MNLNHTDLGSRATAPGIRALATFASDDADLNPDLLALAQTGRPDPVDQ